MTLTSGLLKKEVLNSFKKLHRTRQKVFQNNPEICEKVRSDINNKYRENKNATDVDSIKEMIKLADEVNHELKTSVVELEQVAPLRFRMHIRPEMFEQKEVPSKKN